MYFSYISLVLLFLVLLLFFFYFSLVFLLFAIKGINFSGYSLLFLPPKFPQKFRQEKFFFLCAYLNYYFSVGELQVYKIYNDKGNNYKSWFIKRKIVLSFFSLSQVWLSRIESYCKNWRKQTQKKLRNGWLLRTFLTYISFKKKKWWN